MTCKQCGTDEDRLKGFCSIDCRDKFDYVEEIRELKADLAREKKVMTRWWADHTIQIDKANEGIEKLEKHIALLIEYGEAWFVTDQKNPTQEQMDNEVAEILRGEHSEDCKLTLEQWRATQS